MVSAEDSFCRIEGRGGEGIGSDGHQRILQIPAVARRKWGEAEVAETGVGEKTLKARINGDVGDPEVIGLSVGVGDVKPPLIRTMVLSEES